MTRDWFLLLHGSLYWVCSWRPFWILLICTIDVLLLFRSLFSLSSLCLISVVSLFDIDHCVLNEIVVIDHHRLLAVFEIGEVVDYFWVGLSMRIGLFIQWIWLLHTSALFLNLGGRSEFIVKVLIWRSDWSRLFGWFGFEWLLALYSNFTLSPCVWKRIFANMSQNRHCIAQTVSFFILLLISIVLFNEIVFHWIFHSLD